MFTRFFCTFLFFSIQHYPMNSCSMWTISSLTSRRWTYPISLPSRGCPAVLPSIAPTSPIAATAVHPNLYALHHDRAAAAARPFRCHCHCNLPSQRSPMPIAATAPAVHQLRVTNGSLWPLGLVGSPICTQKQSHTFLCCKC